MVYVAPKLTVDQALLVLSQAWQLARGNKARFVKNHDISSKASLFRLRDPSPVVDSSRQFDVMTADALSWARFRFTIPQLCMLASKLGLPADGVTTETRDRVSSVEALPKVCRRLAEPSQLLTVACEFGRSCGAYSRVVKATVALLYENHSSILYFNNDLIKARMVEYYGAIESAGSPLEGCWGFIDGTKQYISRPSAREDPDIPHENLQRSVYNGHPRRHCLNWQSIQAPDGIIVSLYGPVEDRKHDSTMLSLSGVLDVMEEDEDGTFSNRVIYGDPAYVCSTFVCSPTTDERYAGRIFNSRMSSVRESVEWGFGRLKTLWSYMNWDKKQRVRQGPVGKNFFVAALLTNCHTCLQPLGNQISMYFGIGPPSLDAYLNRNSSTTY